MNRDALRLGIVGGPGSGKSSFAKQLEELFGVVPTELDQFRFLKGWIEIPPKETRTKILEVVSSPPFILDGNFMKFGDDLLEMMNLVIWLDLPLEECRNRVLSRSKEQIRTGEKIHNGNCQTNSSMRKLIQKCSAKHRELRKTLPDLLRCHQFLRLRTIQAVEATLEAFKLLRVSSFTT